MNVLCPKCRKYLELSWEPEDLEACPQCGQVFCPRDEFRAHGPARPPAPEPAAAAADPAPAPAADRYRVRAPASVPWPVTALQIFGLITLIGGVMSLLLEGYLAGFGAIFAGVLWFCFAWLFQCLHDIRQSLQ